MVIGLKRQHNSLINRLLVSVLLLSVCRLQVNASVVQSPISFEGSATGGTLVLGRIELPGFGHSVSINTFAGESAETVVERLVRVFVYSEKMFSSPNPEMQIDRMAKGNILLLGGSSREYYLAGTENGLGIPRPPHSLSCSFNKLEKTIGVHWINPSDKYQYDTIAIESRGSVNGIWVIDRPANTYSIQVSGNVDDLNLDVWVKGYRNKFMPSNVATIHLTNSGSSQEDICVIPFSYGLASNWRAWSISQNPKSDFLEQGLRYNHVYSEIAPRSLLVSPFYQIIKSPGKGNVHGTFRRFLGLTPGHTFRLTMCINTLDMNSMEDNWSLSLHAAPTKGDLTVDQMSGLDSLPYPGSVFKNWMMAYYDPNHTTLGFDFAVTSYTKIRKDVLNSHQFMPEDANQVIVPNITLPSDVSEITVWTQFRCDNPKGKVGLSGLRLEDITAAEDVLLPEQMIELEYQREQEFLKQEADLERRFNKLF